MLVNRIPVGGYETRRDASYRLLPGRCYRVDGGGVDGGGGGGCRSNRSQLTAFIRKHNDNKPQDSRQRLRTGQVTGNKQAKEANPAPRKIDR